MDELDYPKIGSFFNELEQYSASKIFEKQYNQARAPVKEATGEMRNLPSPGMYETGRFLEETPGLNLLAGGAGGLLKKIGGGFKTDYLDYAGTSLDVVPNLKLPILAGTVVTKKVAEKALEYVRAAARHPANAKMFDLLPGSKGIKETARDVENYAKLKTIGVDAEAAQYPNIPDIEDRILYNATGFYTDPEGVVKYWVPDKDVTLDMGYEDLKKATAPKKIKERVYSVDTKQFVDQEIELPGKTLPLHAVMSHPELFALEPNLRHTRVKVGDIGEITQYGDYSEKEDLIRLNSRYFDRFANKPDYQKSRIIEALLHENTHKLQSLANTQRGASSSVFKKMGLDPKDAMAAYRRLYGEVEARLPEGYWTSSRSQMRHTYLPDKMYSEVVPEREISEPGLKKLSMKQKDSDEPLHELNPTTLMLLRSGEPKFDETGKLLNIEELLRGISID